MDIKSIVVVFVLVPVAVVVSLKCHCIDGDDCKDAKCEGAQCWKRSVTQKVGFGPMGGGEETTVTKGCLEKKSKEDKCEDTNAGGSVMGMGASAAITECHCSDKDLCNGKSRGGVAVSLLMGGLVLAALV